MSVHVAYRACRNINATLACSWAQYRDRKRAEHEAWLRRKEERELKLARGEEVGPEEPDPTDEPEVGCIGLLKFFVISLVVVVLAGKFFTGSYLWEQDLKSGLRNLIPVGLFYAHIVSCEKLST